MIDHYETNHPEVALILGATAMSSCAGFVDALLGHEDNPAETPTKPTTISGGTIMAQSDFVGIGCCYESSCGDINISCGENFASLTAIKGNDVESPIGGFGDSECGDIIFDGITIKAKNAYYYNTVIGNGQEYENLKLTISTTLPEGVNKEDEEAVKPYKDNTWTLTPIVH